MSTSATTCKRWLPRWAAILIVIAMLAAAVPGYVYVRGLSSTSEWERYAAELRAAGEPLTFAEIEATRPEVPDDQNGALTIEGLMPELKNPPGPPADPIRHTFLRLAGELDLFDGIPRKSIVACREFMNSHTVLLDKLEKLRDRSTGRFRIERKVNPYETLVPHLSAVNNAAKLVYLRGILRLSDADIEGAADTALLLCHISGTLDGEGILISRLQQGNCDAMAVQLMEGCLRAGELDDNMLARVAEAIAARRTWSTLRWGIRGERAGLIAGCDAIISGDLPLSFFKSFASVGGGPLPVLPPWIPVKTIRQNQIRGTEMLTWLVDACDDTSAMIKAAGRIAEERRTLPKRYDLLRFMVHDYTRSCLGNHKNRMRLDAARVGIAVERFRIATGRFPEQVDQLIPEYINAVPADTAGNQTVLLVPTDRGIDAMSFGIDFFDGKGEYTGPRAANVSFRLLKTEHRGLTLTDDPPPEDG